MKRGITALVAVIVLGGGVYWLVNQPGDSTSTDGVNTDSSAMRAEENMVVVTEQRPGNIVTASTVFLAAPGFVVVHEDIDGAPGAIIGSSAFLAAGESNNIKVMLSRVTQDGDKLHAMLHADTDANGSFSSADMPVQSRLGGPLEGWFEISSSASENIPVTI